MLKKKKTRHGDPQKPAAPKPGPEAGTTDPPFSRFPVVGIGASAGGLAAFEAFFSGMPADSDLGMAFVLVQHLDPNHKSLLTDLIQRRTRMKVFEVEDGMKVRPDCVYIIPPNRDMAFMNGRLQLLEPSAPRGLRLPIDFFFRSLAQDQRERGICVVLSGTGSDGTQGVRAIKGEGGMAMAQDPGSTEHSGMPQSAIGTGLVDFVLPPAEMPDQLMKYVSRAFGVLRGADTLEPDTENALRKLLLLLRTRTGHDFSQYKPSTILRRVRRRMAVHQIDTLAEYAKHSQQEPAELGALFRDLLIGVTSFFRDPEAFKGLEEQVVSKLFSGKPAGTAIRVWTPGCSTGEEAYSIAILLQERLSALRVNHRVQVFATDIDSQAVAAARAGLYPASISAEVSPERLARFFTPEPEGASYRVHKSIRDMLVFSEQDVIKDPPFSKLDLISCRNLMIYMGAELQKKLIPLFHYALNPGGALFLGTSETVGDFSDLFSCLDRKSKLYQRRDDIHARRKLGLTQYPPTIPEGPGAARQAKKPSAAARPSLRHLTEQALLLQVAPAGALVSENGDILYLHGRTGMFLEPASGEAGPNILRMARQGLRQDLAKALARSAKDKAVVTAQGVRVKTNGDFKQVDLTIRPISPDPAEPGATPLFLVVLEEARHPASGKPRPGPRPAVKPDDPGTMARIAALKADNLDEDPNALVAALKAELRYNEEYLQSLNEELETSNEELKSSNEEMQSVNEELQSTNEELETSKEELQSINEELATVNAELQTKVADLSRSNNDMNNLLAGTGIATVFVDHQLRILRFTPAATRIINLIPTDVGRPVGHIVSNLTGYDSLTADARAVLETLAPKEAEARSTDGRWYSLRIMPYRTLENVIEGAVITFLDITEVKTSREILQESEARFRQVAESLPLLVWTSDPDGTFDYLSPQWTAFTGAPASRLKAGGWLELVHPDDRSRFKAAWSHAVSSGKVFEAEFRLLHRQGSHHRFATRATSLRDASGNIVRWFGISMDMTPGEPREGAGPSKAGRTRGTGGSGK